MHGMGDAAGLRPRTVDVLLAQSEDLISRAVTLPVTTIIAFSHPPGRGAVSAAPRKSGTYCAASAASVNPQTPRSKASGSSCGSSALHPLCQTDPRLDLSAGTGRLLNSRPNRRAASSMAAVVCGMSVEPARRIIRSRRSSRMIRMKITNTMMIAVAASGRSGLIGRLRMCSRAPLGSRTSTGMRAGELFLGRVFAGCLRSACLDPQEPAAPFPTFHRSQRDGGRSGRYCFAHQMFERAIEPSSQ